MSDGDLFLQASEDFGIVCQVNNLRLVRISNSPDAFRQVERSRNQFFKFEEFIQDVDSIFLAGNKINALFGYCPSIEAMNCKLKEFKVVDRIYIDLGYQPIWHREVRAGQIYLRSLCFFFIFGSENGLANRSASIQAACERHEQRFGPDQVDPISSQSIFVAGPLSYKVARQSLPVCDPQGCHDSCEGSCARKPIGQASDLQSSRREARCGSSDHHHRNCGPKLRPFLSHPGQVT